jgi:hypothetical protein
MSLLLGVRMALAGGRESLARMGLMAAGVAAGVVLLLFSVTAMPALQSRIDRLAWHRTDAASPPTAADPALWLPVTDWYAGRQVVRVQVAALGPRPPVPPGLERLPGPGEVAVSPALARLIATAPADQLGDRFPGRITGTVGEPGLISPAELVAVIGRAPADLRAVPGAYEIRGIEQPGDPIDLRAFLRAAVVLLAVLLVGPVLVFVSMVTRIGAARREQRFAAIRLAGATRWQTGLLAATETALAAAAGALLGWAGYLALRPLAASRITVDGTPFFLTDLTAPAAHIGLVLVAVPLLTMATTLVALHRVQITPLGTGRRVRRRPPRSLRLAPLAGGILTLSAGTRLADDTAPEGSPTAGTLTIVGALSILAGVVLAGPWVCLLISRGLARLSRHATTLIAARRIAADPYTTFRAVGGVALAAFTATVFGAAPSGTPAPDSPAVLKPDVVAIQARGASDAALAPLVAAGAVVARWGSAGQLIAPCADLARISELTCPIRVDPEQGPPLGFFHPTAFADPRPGDEKLPIHSLYVPTDGSSAAQERIRTLVAAVAPSALSRTDADWAYSDETQLDGVATGMRLAMVFVLLVAACSLTVAMVAGLMERRRPFALLRASGVRLADLRRIALLETAVPLLLTAAAGMAAALITGYASTPPANWHPPNPAFFAQAAAAVLIALAICTLTLPLMNAATHHTNIRYE